ncbi:MAG: osmoprotectant transporter permease [Sphingomonadales bacterium]
MIGYRLLQGVVGAAAAVLLWFFAAGLGDGTIDASNIALWLVLLAIPIAGLLLAASLWSAGKRAAAIVLLAIPAVPALLYGCFVLLIVVTQPTFR